MREATIAYLQRMLRQQAPPVARRPVARPRLAQAQLTHSERASEAALRQGIQQVDVEQIIAQQTTPTVRETRNPARSFRIIPPSKKNTVESIGAAALAALAITAIPKVAFAGTLGVTLAGLAATPLGAAGIATGVALLISLYVKHMFSFDKSMQKRNANPGDFTFAKQLATFGGMVSVPLIVGPGLVYLAVSLSSLPATPVFLGLAGAGLLYGVVQATRGAIKTKKSFDQTITQGYKVGGWRQIITSNYHSYMVQLSESAYTFYRGATLSVLFYEIATETTGKIVAAGLGGATSHLLYFGLPLFLLVSSYSRIVSKRRNELQSDFGFRYDLKTRQGIRNVMIAVGACAAIGVVAAPVASYAITVIAALAFFSTEAHGFVHNFRAQSSSRDVIHKAPNEYSDSEIWQTSQRPKSPWITILKPRFNMDEFFVFCVGTLFMREGTNWDFLNIFSTMGRHKDLAVEKECKRFYREKQQRILDIVAVHKQQIETLDPSRLRDKYILLGKLYEALAAHWEKEAEGDFSSFSVPGNKYSGRANVFTSDKANNLEKYLGKLFQYKAKKMRAQGEKLQRRRHGLTEAEISERLEGLERQYSAIFHTFNVNMHRNSSYDSKRSKIRKVDFYNMLTATFKTGASVLKKNRLNGEYYWEMIPCRRVLKLNHESQTLGWDNRSEAEMTETVTNLGRIQRLGGVETYSDLACLDNTRVSDPTGSLYTDEGYNYGHMKSGESQTVEFKDGRQKTFHADGRVTWKTSDGRAFIPDPAQPHIIETQTNKKGETVFLFDNGTKQILDQSGEVKKTIEADEVIWVPGMPLPAELEADLPAEFRGADGKVHEDVIKPTLTHFVGSKYQTMLDGEHVDITLSHYLARLEEDLQNPYVVAMYKVPEKVTVPNALHLKENETDRLARVHGSLTPFMIRVKEKGDGREYYLPYNFKKSGLFNDDFWAHVTDVKLMSREEFVDEYGVVASDGHYDRHPNVIVPFDSNGNRVRTLSAKALMRGVAGKNAFEKAANAEKLFNELVKLGYLKHVSGEGEVSVGIVQPSLEKAIRDNSLPGVLASNPAAKAIAENAVNSGQVMPYSFFLKDPEQYKSIEFDRGLGRCGDRHMVAYTFERADGSRYMRWLPKPGDSDWPEIDFTEKHQRLEIKGDKIIVHACRFIGKRFSIDKHRLGLDSGTHDKPNFAVIGIEGPERFVQGKNRFVLARTHTRTVDGHPERSHTVFDYKGKDLISVIDQRQIDGQTLEIVKATTEDKRVVKLGATDQLNFEPSFIESVKLEPATSDDKVCVTITYKNPYTGEAIEGRDRTQKVYFDRKTAGLPKDLNSVYNKGGNSAFLPKIFDQRQNNEKTGEISSQAFLVFYTAKTETVTHGLSLEADEDLRLIEVKSSLHIKHITDVAGKAGTDEWVPFDHAMPTASKSELYFSPEDAPFSSGLEFGELDTMVGPQHLVPRDSVKGGLIDDFIKAPLLGRGNGGQESATDDQKYYFGEIEGEYNWFAGWVDDRKMPAMGSRGVFSLQYGKSQVDAALNTGSNTVMRAPHEEMLFPQFGEELELYAEDEMPIGMSKSLFDGDSITEDAEGAWQKGKTFCRKTEYDPTVRTAGASVEGKKQAKGQRWRWAAMAARLQRAAKMVYNEIWRARIKKEIPTQYTTIKQMQEWFSTDTWYFDAAFKHVVPAIPFLFMLGLTPLPVDPVVFPILWAIKAIFSWTKYSSDSQKGGVHRSRSYFRNIALTLVWQPALLRGVGHIVDTARGKFETVGPPNGNMLNGWEIRRLVYWFGGLSWSTTAFGLYQVAVHSITSFGLMMNVIWPGFMSLLVIYSLRMVWMEMLKHHKINNISPLTKEGIKARYNVFNKEILRPLTVDWVQELGTALRNAGNYYARGEV